MYKNIKEMNLHGKICRPYNKVHNSNQATLMDWAQTNTDPIIFHRIHEKLIITNLLMQK